MFVFEVVEMEIEKINIWFVEVKQDDLYKDGEGVFKALWLRFYHQLFFFTIFNPQPYVWQAGTRVETKTHPTPTNGSTDLGKTSA